MDVGVGDVVKIEGDPRLFVIMALINREDASSMSYDREYNLAELDLVIATERDGKLLDISQGKIFKMIGTNPDKLIGVDDEIPFAVDKLVLYKVRRRRAVHVTVYE
jgi:hypothetical protein